MRTTEKIKILNHARCELKRVRSKVLNGDRFYYGKPLNTGSFEEDSKLMDQDKTTPAVDNIAGEFDYFINQSSRLMIIINDYEYSLDYGELKQINRILPAIKDYIRSLIINSDPMYYQLRAFSNLAGHAKGFINPVRQLTLV